VIKGSTFIHPALRFAFDAPKGMKLKNSPDAVIGSGGNAAMLFDLASPAPGGALTQYVASQWQEGAKVSDVQAFQVNGMEAATGLAKGTINDTAVVVRMVAIRQSAKTVYRFMYAAPPGNFDSMDQSFLRSAQSFREVSAQEVSGFQPKRIRVITVRPGDTIASLAQQMQVDEAPADWFRVLNHLGPNAKLQAGQKVKIVVNGGAQISALPADAAAKELALALQ
jgi:predicted Zn-dependent protease